MFRQIARENPVCRSCGHPQGINQTARANIDPGVFAVGARFDWRPLFVFVIRRRLQLDYECLELG